MNAIYQKKLLVDYSVNGLVHIAQEMLEETQQEDSQPLSLLCTNMESLKLITRLSGTPRSHSAEMMFISNFRFFRVCTEICADVSPQDDIKSRYHVYNQIDAFVRLVCLLIRHSGDAHNPGKVYIPSGNVRTSPSNMILMKYSNINSATKVNLLNKVLGIVIGICMDHQKNSPDFYPMPFQRIFTMLFYELCNPEAVLESINWHTLMAFSNAYHYLCPMKGTCLQPRDFSHLQF